MLNADVGEIAAGRLKVPVRITGRIFEEQIKGGSEEPPPGCAGAT
jgi:hypothetical protein